jgi:uncharacterized protein (TIGR03437 family)
VLTLLPNGFSVPAGFPGQVEVKVIDDCANLMTTGNVVAGFSNGDPSIQLTSLKNGTWAATWTPGRSANVVTVNIDAQIPEQNLKGSIQVKGALQTLESPPSVNAGMIVNGASYSQQSPVAPGSVISIYGSRLAQSTTAASSNPLPTDLSGTSVLLAGREAPLMYASDGRIDAIVPYGLSVNASQQILVSRGSSISVPQQITLAAASPGIFSADGTGKGQGKILTVDGALADSAHPVKSGDTVLIYSTGLGEVDPPVSAGNLTSGDPSVTILPVGVSIGGVAAQVLFSGLNSSGPGTYLVKAVVPDGVTPGDQTPVTLTSAGQQSAQVTISVGK